MIWTLAELNRIRKPKIYLIQVWVWSWAYHNGRLAPKQQDYKSQCLYLETSKRSIKSLAKIGQFFKKLKFNQEPRGNIFILQKKICSLNILHKQYLYYKVK